MVWKQLKGMTEVTELADFAILLLGIVVNQAGNERDFSDLKIKKTRLRNRLGIPKLQKMSKVRKMFTMYKIRCLPVIPRLVLISVQKTSCMVP
jgi:hypothetical protein